jgi:hypothetical protein
VCDTSSAFYRRIKLPVYGPEVFKDLGRAFCISLLDLVGLNPLSRLLKTPSDTFDEALAKVRKDLKREFFAPSIKSMKKKGKKGKKKNFGPSFELVLGADDHVKAAAGQSTQEPDTDEEKNNGVEEHELN